MSSDPMAPSVALSELPPELSTSSETRPLWKIFLFFLAPMLLSNILQSLSGTLNNIYVGQMLGVSALAAV